MSATAPRESFDGGRLPKAAAITVVAAVAVNLPIYVLATAIVDAPDRFTPLQPGSVIFLTVIGVLAAAGVCRLLIARSARRWPRFGGRVHGDRPAAPASLRPCR